MAGDIIYGFNAVREALERGGIVNRMYIAVETRGKIAAQLIDHAKRTGTRVDYVPQAKLNELTETMEHQGVAAAISPVSYVSLDECIEQCPQHALILVLDQIQHPKNLGLLIRTAVGAGAAGIVLSSHGGMLLDESIVRASAGTVLRIPIVACADLPRALREIKEHKFWVYGLDAQGKDNVFVVPWAERTALVLGNETKGMRPSVRKVCDATVSIPLANGLDSLNAAVAAGVAMFQVRQCHVHSATP
jgi:23S rRNA (guanosine2251-2'-O)-methyltransferase